jgi:hypothetical protein
MGGQAMVKKGASNGEGEPLAGCETAAAIINGYSIVMDFHWIVRAK